MKGRWDDVRQPTEKELKGTTVLSIALEEVSAKVRTGGPIDDEATTRCRSGQVSSPWKP